MRPVDVKFNSYIDHSVQSNDKDSKFKVGHRVRTSKYENILAKDYIRNLSEELFVVKKVKNNLPWTYVINDLNGEEIVGAFYEKELQRTSQTQFRIKKLIKRKGDKLYVKWIGFDNSFNKWIGMKGVSQTI